MLLELAGHAAILSPVAGVVWTHGELVDKDLWLAVLVEGFKKLDCQDTSDAEFSGDLLGQSPGGFLQFCG